MKNTDQVKGRVKEAAGALTDDDSLKRSGKADQATGKAKEVTDGVREKVDGAVEAADEKLHRR